jgi:glycosyltransferase involved in cell wall biosynthesis
MKVYVAHSGRKAHYCLARALQKKGILEAFFTDFYCPQWFSALLKNPILKPFLPIWARRIIQRRSDDVPDKKVIPFILFGLKYMLKCRYTKNNRTALFVKGETEFYSNIIKKNYIKKADILYTFCDCGVEFLQYAKSKKIKSVVEQNIAPENVLLRILKEEQSNFPDWSCENYSNELQNELYFLRNRNVRLFADMVICPSEFVKKGLEQAGIPCDKIKIVPYAFGNNIPDGRPVFKENRFNILFPGTIGLRKGFQYYMKTADLIKDKKIFFKAIGRIDLMNHVIKNAKRNIDVQTRIASDMDSEYLNSHLVILPTLCEGSAMVCFEALAYGVPVITTPNAGSFVRDGLDGFIVPIRDSETIAQKIELLKKDKKLWTYMSNNAKERSKDFTLEKYSIRLMKALSWIFNKERT